MTPASSSASVLGRLGQERRARRRRVRRARHGVPSASDALSGSAASARPRRGRASRGGRRSRPAHRVAGRLRRARPSSARRCRGSTSRGSSRSSSTRLAGPGAEQRVVAAEQPAVDAARARRRRAPPRARAGCRGRRRAAPHAAANLLAPCDARLRPDAHAARRPSRPTPRRCSTLACDRRGDALVLLGALHDASTQPLAYIERRAGQRERGEQLDLARSCTASTAPVGITGLSEFSAARPPRDRRHVVRRATSGARAPTASPRR